MAEIQVSCNFLVNICSLSTLFPNKNQKSLCMGCMQISIQATAILSPISGNEMCAHFQRTKISIVIMSTHVFLHPLRQGVNTVNTI